ncbi:erythromycin esterase family protein [Aneurinibacillus migulanus]|uniref:Erythromycin esterase n=1 Tax=Aneurinibacillus migulanus TaxID=47500 RepID=A0A1G8GPT4_ANEMI|nr:erythromycin esterase family protein [Aneurinibacillus migulanus]MED0891098.1 erythromycin esterase family protein [Aneurinibacillus migulanus]MED1614214.1 erythromycin esterase family protein [Aneurinibacillus migulanus]GED12928.1 putative hydrolase YbfO [Aneurinibacillus migulanus]SDH96356.1 erythromycin esterase [Aneurinibacillus migulanus]
MKRKFALAVLTATLASTVLPQTYANVLAAPSSESAQNKKQTEQETWGKWVRNHAHGLDTIEPATAERKDTFSDLKFLKQALKDKRIVLLGESSHGTAEFSSAKVRLIQFLHQEMGYDVIAFESGLGEASAAFAQADSQTSLDTMKQAIYPVWHTKETLPLFDYIKQNTNTEHPLILTGFDMQPHRTFTPFARQWFAHIDAERATQLEQTERQLAQLFRLEATLKEFSASKSKLVQQYNELKKFIKDNKDALQRVYPDRPELISIVDRVFDSRLRALNEYLEPNIRLYENYQNGKYEPPASLEENPIYLRDKAMAEDLAWLAETLYPDKKIIVWGHNSHIRKKSSGVKNDLIFGGAPNMTELLPERLKEQAYSIGLYMYQGENADNSQEKHPVKQPENPESLEMIMKQADQRYAFADMAQEKRKKGTEWMFESRPAFYWGGMFEEQFVPREQYEGILQIDTVHAPHYLTGESEKKQDKE